MPKTQTSLTSMVGIFATTANGIVWLCECAESQACTVMDDYAEREDLDALFALPLVASLNLEAMRDNATAG